MITGSMPSKPFGPYFDFIWVHYAEWTLVTPMLLFNLGMLAKWVVQRGEGLGEGLIEDPKPSRAPDAFTSELSLLTSHSYPLLSSPTSRPLPSPSIPFPALPSSAA